MSKGLKHEYHLTRECGEDYPSVKWYCFCPFNEPESLKILV